MSYLSGASKALGPLAPYIKDCGGAHNGLGGGNVAISPYVQYSPSVHASCPDCFAAPLAVPSCFALPGIVGAVRGCARSVLPIVSAQPQLSWAQPFSHIGTALCHIAQPHPMYIREGLRPSPNAPESSLVDLCNLSLISLITSTFESDLYLYYFELYWLFSS